MNKGVVRLVQMAVLLWWSCSISAVYGVPPCMISGSDVVCASTTNTFNAPIVIGASYSWTLFDNSTGASIAGSTNSSSVLVVSGAAGGAFTVRVAVVHAGSTNICTQPVQVLEPIYSQFVGLGS